MKSIEKYQAIENIYNAYQKYNGDEKSLLEFEISKLEDKIEPRRYKKIQEAFDKYKHYIFKLLANSRLISIGRTSQYPEKQKENTKEEDIFKIPE